VVQTFLTTGFLGTLKNCKMRNYVSFIQLPGLFLSLDALFTSVSSVCTDINIKVFFGYLSLVMFNIFHL